MHPNDQKSAASPDEPDSSNSGEAYSADPTNVPCLFLLSSFSIASENLFLRF